MIPRGLAGIALAAAALSVLSLYRETLGVPISALALLTTMLFWVTQATSWTVLSGYSGYFSLGQAAYVGTGAYTTAVLFGRHHVDLFLTIVIAAVLCGILALGMGLLAFRLRSLRGEIFALLTLAVPFILAALARINGSIDGGQGIIVAIPAFPAQLGQFQDFLYLLTLAVATLAVAAGFLLARLRSGWALTAIRDAEDVAEALGVATLRYKLQALVASAVIGGIGGSVFALQIGFVTVDSVFNLTVPLFVIVMSVLGGRTHWLGPVLGAALVVLLQDRLAALDLLGWQPVILGAVLVLVILLAPEGIYPKLRALWPSRRQPTVPPVVESEVDSKPVDESAPVLLACAELARHFGGVHAVESLTVEIREGELVGLVGPNGSGKTTLVNLLAGSVRPTRGTIHILGHNTTGLAPHRIAHAGVARTYQIPRPFDSMTVRDNVAMAVLFGRVPHRLGAARRIAERQLAVVGLAHLASARPAALNLHQRQLLEIARALATEPKLLLLDEALAGLNPAEIDNAVRVIRRVHASGITIVLVEHLLRVVKALATRVVVLDRGVLLADGDPGAVLSDPAVVRAYLGKRAHA